MNAELILVLGMHRSGTSCLTGLLGDAGVWLGPVEKGSPHNPKGNNENRQVMNLNKAVLAANDASWLDPPRFDAAWPGDATQRAEQILDEILAPGRITAMKDPRSLYTARGWIRGARRRGARIRMIGTFRRPERVVASLRARDDTLDEADCRDLWCRYNERLLMFHGEDPFPLLDFDVDAADYLASVRIAFTAVGLAPPEELTFFETDLRHHDDEVPLSAREAAILEQLHERRVDVS
jgi:hypothetical protein